MTARKKLTDEQIRFARHVVAKRTEALRVARLYPTLDQLADQLGCTRRYLDDVVKGRARNLLTPEHSA